MLFYKDFKLCKKDIENMLILLRWLFTIHKELLRIIGIVILLYYLIIGTHGNGYVIIG